MSDHAEPRSQTTDGPCASDLRDIPAATVARLPVYHRTLSGLLEDNVATVSSAELAGLTGVTSAKVRKDLSHLGSYGVRGVGYDVAYLNYQISRGLGLANDWRVLIVGAGNLGRALACYPGFRSRSFSVVGLLDSDESLVGQTVGPFGIAIGRAADLQAEARRTRPNIGVIATPAESAQASCDGMVRAGVSSILNFAPIVLVVPDGVQVRMVDLGLELQILAFHEQQRLVGSPVGAGVPRDINLARHEAGRETGHEGSDVGSVLGAVSA